MNSDRIDELLKQTAYPESSSVREAMLQIWNEMQQEHNSHICSNCKHLKVGSTCEALKEHIYPEYYVADNTDFYLESYDIESTNTFGCTQFKRN